MFQLEELKKCVLDLIQRVLPNGGFTRDFIIDSAFWKYLQSVLYHYCPSSEYAVYNICNSRLFSYPTNVLLFEVKDLGVFKRFIVYGDVFYQEDSNYGFQRIINTRDYIIGKALMFDNEVHVLRKEPMQVSAYLENNGLAAVLMQLDTTLVDDSLRDACFETKHHVLNIYLRDILPRLTYNQCCHHHIFIPARRSIYYPFFHEVMEDFSFSIASNSDMNVVSTYDFTLPIDVHHRQEALRSSVNRELGGEHKVRGDLVSRALLDFLPGIWKHYYSVMPKAYRANILHRWRDIDFYKTSLSDAIVQSEITGTKKINRKCIIELIHQNEE